MNAATDVGVRDLCEFSARRGDLSLRFTPAPTAEQGRFGHAVVAQRRGPGYETEIALHAAHGGVQVKGRADGFDPVRGVLEEIKTFKGSLESIAANQRELHWAQLKVYGWMLCQQRALPHVDLALIYFDVIDQTEHPLQQRCEAASLRGHFELLCNRFARWAQAEAVHRSARDRQLDDLDFPQLPFRPGQRDMAASVYRACVQSRPLLVQAPTGIGKSLGTLYPALRAMPVRGTDKVFFLTAKTSGRQVALDALARIRQVSTPQPTPLRVLELVAREKTCDHPQAQCHGAFCPLAAGFFDRLPQARDAAAQTQWLDQAALRGVALAHGVCPYYLSLEMLRWSDVIVGDYNYYFDRSAVLHALTEQSGWRVTVLIDEAHNLYQRACAMYSADLRLHEALQARATLPAGVRARLDAWVAQWHSLLAEKGPVGQETSTWLDEIPALWDKALLRLVGGLAEHLESDTSASAPPWLDFFFRLQNLAALADAFGEHSLCELDASSPAPSLQPVQPTRASHQHHLDFTDSGAAATGRLSLRNIVPAPFLAARWKAADATALFSATLNPQRYYVDLLGLPENTPLLDVPTPFSASQLQVKVLPVSTRRADRAATVDRLAQTMARQFDEVPGNYLAFFSSFDYLELALARLRSKHPGLPVWVQERDMSEMRRNAFLERFQVEGKGIGFAVLGGAFAEGVDLPGRRLIGAFVATLGLPQFDAFNEAACARLDQRFGRGHDYTYVFPGLQKVIQAAGRVIRSEMDHGTLWLFDERYLEHRYRQHLPRWWRMQVASTSRQAV